MPLTGIDGKDYRGEHCLYCSDEGGNLYPAEVVQKGIAQWLRTISPEDDSADFMKRATYYMMAMPAWASQIKEN
jgi:hypothetical protein